MKILHCPINGPRPLQEFDFGGELRPMSDPATADDAEWADYVFLRRGEPGVKREWWHHNPSGTWFIAERDNRSDQVLRTYLWTPEQANCLAHLSSEEIAARSTPPGAPGGASA